MTIKLSSLSLFLILLIVLFVSYFIGNWFSSEIKTKENFISFDYDGSIGSTIKIPEYSGTSSVNKVAKVYDNVFFDIYNGNLIEVDGTKYDGKSENTGSSISNIYILSRNNAGNPVSSYKTQPTNQIVQTSESNNTFTNSFREFVYSTQSTNTNPYVVFYLPWNDSTYLHIIDISGGNNLQNHKHLVTELYYESTQNTINYNNSFLQFKSKNNIDDLNASNNNFVRLSSYDGSYNVYQMSSNIYFDVRNAQVIIVNGDTNALSVYPRKYDKTLIDKVNYLSQTSVISTDLNTWTAYDSKGNKMVLYISIAQKTLLVIIEPDNNNKYRIFNLKRFLTTGLDNGESTTMLSSSSSSSSNINTNTNTTTNKNATIDDYYKWFYLNSINGGQNGGISNVSDNYILKTQIVPPVCPSCPSCPSVSGVCTNCGGNGGSGTQGTNVVTQGTNVVTQGTNTPGQSITNSVNATAGVVNNAVNTSANLLYAGASGTKDLVENTASGVKDLVEDTGSGVKNLVEDTGSGIVNLAKSVGSGITQLGASTDISNNNRNYNDNSINRLGYYNSNGAPIINQSSVTDPYSYFGAVPSKPGNFMPITTDFSKFGR
jgi:hypothetical protein